MNINMETLDIVSIIAENFLCVRRLPFQVINCTTYKEGDENIKYVDSKGNPSESIREVVVRDYDLEHFQKTKPSKWNNQNPEQRFAEWKRRFPNGQKILKETKNIKLGGWWMVKEVRDTSDTVRFSMDFDTFFAPTLEEAIQLYLNSKK